MEAGGGISPAERRSVAPARRVRFEMVIVMFDVAGLLWAIAVMLRLTSITVPSPLPCAVTLMKEMDVQELSIVSFTRGSVALISVHGIVAMHRSGIIKTRQTRQASMFSLCKKRTFLRLF